MIPSSRSSIWTVARSFAIGLAVMGLAATFVPPVAGADGETAPDRDNDGLTDTFETTWGVTDPDSRDSDGDGILDSAEDADGDGLGNLGEQRYQTDPSDPDTDSDGVPDGEEDADADGLSDALEQDDRPVPTILRPTLANARDDRGKAYVDGCHTTVFEADLHPCVYGDPDGPIDVALYGDSHVLQWLPALEPPAREHGWRITILTKSACPSVEVDFEEPVNRARRGENTVGPSAVETCLTWRIRAQRWLARNVPDVIIVSNRGRYNVVDARGKVLKRPANEPVWAKGLAQTLRKLPGDARVVVLADTPRLKTEPAPCLAERGVAISACVTSRERAMLVAHDDAERAAAEANGAWFTDLHEEVCPYDPCPVVIEDILMWRDQSHVTATYARELAPSLEALVEHALGIAPKSVAVGAARSSTSSAEEGDSAIAPQIDRCLRRP